MLTSALLPALVKTDRKICNVDFMWNCLRFYLIRIKLDNVCSFISLSFSPSFHMVNSLTKAAQWMSDLLSLFFFLMRTCMWA